MAKKNKITNLLIISEQLEQINLIEAALKTQFLLNIHKSNAIMEAKNVLSHEQINLIIIDDAPTTIGVGSIKNAINDIRLETPILQLIGKSQDKAAGEFLKNGANAICYQDDKLSILHYAQLLMNFHAYHSAVKKDNAVIAAYQQKFNDLYVGLADPVCYLHDGVFVDCNPAFLRSFEVSDKEELDELTILNFVNRKAHSEIKAHLRKSTKRDLSATPVLFQMQTKLGKEVEYVIMSKPAQFNDEEVVQVYMRSTAEGGGGGGASLYDETTGLANRGQMGFYLSQKIQQFHSTGGSAMLAYVIIKNYRDVWGADGFEEAEKFIKSVTQYVRKTMPVHTETARYTDDGLLMYIPNLSEEQTNETLTNLVKGLDKITPEGMERMVEPVCYAGYGEIDKSTDYQELTSRLFRTARAASLSESSARVNQPVSVEIAKKDSKRLEDLQAVIKHSQMKMQYHPIASFEPDGVERYRERLFLLDPDGKTLDAGIMFNVAERYELTHQIDMRKMNLLFDKLLSMDLAKREKIQIFISISSDSLKHDKFTPWLAKQMVETGLNGKHFVFEISSDDVQNAYSGAINFCKVMRKGGGKIAVTKIGILNEANTRVLDDIKPEIIKLDLREIDTLDDNEETEVMGAIQQKAASLQALLIAEYLGSPGQLSRIWPYDIKFIQGEGMTPIVEDLDFNFSEFAL